MMRRILEEALETAKQSEAFGHYLHVRERVLAMLEQANSAANRPSDYWEDELPGFDYMLDASPLIIRKLREHCYHLTGLRANEYRGHHAYRKQMFARKLLALQQQDQDNLLVPESLSLGGFGYDVEGLLINLDTLKYYECLIALNKSGLLGGFQSVGAEKKVVIEIGGGWGGFAYQFKTLYPRTCYIIVDLPQTLLFSAVYLKTLFPESSVLMFGDKPEERLLEDHAFFDFIFLPHFFFPRIRLSDVDLAINMVSFQEMTSIQVDSYIRKITELGCPHFYSLNKDRSPYNRQLTAVSAILENYYELEEIRVLNEPYTSLPATNGSSKRDKVRSIARKLLRWDQTPSLAYEYRHLVGSLKCSSSGFRPAP